ncbi:hypothetical protein OPQ81_011859 [Rhizoctonia solani]|nr:hypothetical protein OPQ81_011859 [Rhizoctonia solani]
MAGDDGGIRALDQGVGYGIVVGIGAFFALLMLLITYMQNRYTAYSTKQSEEFNTASRSVKPGLIAAGIVSSWTWSSTLLTSSTFAYSYGIGGPMWYAAMGSSQILLFALIAIKIKTQAPGAHTFPEIILAHHGRANHLTYLFFAWATNLLVGSCLVLGGSQVVAAMSGVNVYGACFLIPFVVAAYVIAGGLRSTFIADYAHTVILFIAIFTFGFSIYATNPEVGSISRFYDLLKEAGRDRPIEGNAHGGSYLTFKSNDGLVFAIDLLVAGPETSVKAYLFGGMSWYGIPFGFATAMGLGCAALTASPSFPTFPDPLSAAQNGSGLSAPAAAIALLGARRRGSHAAPAIHGGHFVHERGADCRLELDHVRRVQDVYQAHGDVGPAGAHKPCRHYYLLCDTGLLLLHPQRRGHQPDLGSDRAGRYCGRRLDSRGHDPAVGAHVLCGRHRVAVVGRAAESEHSVEAKNRLHKILYGVPPPEDRSGPGADGPRLTEGANGSDIEKADCKAPVQGADVEEQPPPSSPAPGTVVPTGNAVVDFLEASYSKPMDPEAARKATRLAYAFNIIYWVLALILVPFTFFGSEWEFSRAGFTGWCVMSFIWLKNRVTHAVAAESTLYPTGTKSSGRPPLPHEHDEPLELRQVKSPQSKGPPCAGFNGGYSSNTLPERICKEGPKDEGFDDTRLAEAVHTRGGFRCSGRNTCDSLVLSSSSSRAVPWDMSLPEAYHSWPRPNGRHIPSFKRPKGVP